MSTVDHRGRHVWTGTTPRNARCAYMTCNARPSRADIARSAAEAAVARSMRIDIDYVTPGSRLGRGLTRDDELARVLRRYPGADRGIG